jgi:hypothetical protein
LQDKTWGRIYIQYEINGQLYFIFKNWLKFKEHTFKGCGDLRDEPSYNWFLEDRRHEYVDLEAVKSGAADHLFLTPEKYRKEYGTPSKILKRLFIELMANLGEPIQSRRGWFKPDFPEIKYSRLEITAEKRILLPAYEVEIKLEPLHKTVYLFFLNHPEGVALNELEKHKEEILQIYKSIRPDGVKEKVNKSLESLTNTKLDNSMHEKISGIKRIFVSEIGEVLAGRYIIKGGKNEPYRIDLSIEMVTVEVPISLNK